MKRTVFIFIAFFLKLNNASALGFDYSEKTEVTRKICKPVQFETQSLFPYSILINDEQINLDTVKSKCGIPDCVESNDGHCYMDGIIEENGKNKEVAFFESSATRDKAINRLVKEGFCVSL